MQFAPLYPILFHILKPAFPQCLWSGNQNTRAIALTFDDGPHPNHTPQLLEVLDRYGIIASFFWLGEWVNRYPELAKAVYNRGHWIGLHGYTHRSFPLLGDNVLKQSLQETQEAIANACQLELHHVQTSVRDVRPPNGLFTPQTLQRLRQWNYRPVMWSVVPEDWTQPGISVVVQRVLQQVQPGSLIVLHDGDCSGQDVAQTTDRLIPLLLKQGYQFISIDRLWQSVMGTGE